MLHSIVELKWYITIQEGQKDRERDYKIGTQNQQIKSCIGGGMIRTIHSPFQ